MFEVQYDVSHEMREQIQKDVDQRALLPGEWAYLNPEIKVAGDTDEARKRREMAFEGGAIVSSTHVTEAPDGRYLLSYRFDGIDLDWPAVYFTEDPRIRHLYGVMTRKDGTLWFVPLDSRSEEPVLQGEPMRVVSGSSRLSAFHRHPDMSEESYFEMLCEGDGEGEYVLAPSPEVVGAWFVFTIPWNSEPSEQSLALAVDAIAKRNSEIVPGSFRQLGHVVGGRRLPRNVAASYPAAEASLDRPIQAEPQTGPSFRP